MPSLVGEPLLPPPLVFSDCSLFFQWEIGAAFGYRGKGTEADRSPQYIDPVRIAQFPGTGASVSRIVDPLRSETLRAPFVQRDAILQICSVPSRNRSGCGAIIDQKQYCTLELRLYYGMLSDD